MAGKEFGRQLANAGLVGRNGFANLEHSFDNGWKVRATYSHGDRKSDSHLLYLSGVPDRVTGTGMFAFSGSYVTHTRQDDAGLHAMRTRELARHLGADPVGGALMKRFIPSRPLTIAVSCIWVGIY